MPVSKRSSRACDCISWHELTVLDRRPSDVFPLLNGNIDLESTVAERSLDEVHVLETYRAAAVRVETQPKWAAPEDDVLEAVRALPVIRGEITRSCTAGCPERRIGPLQVDQLVTLVLAGGKSALVVETGCPYTNPTVGSDSINAVARARAPGVSASSAERSTT